MLQFRRDAAVGAPPSCCLHPVRPSPRKSQHHQNAKLRMQRAWLGSAGQPSAGLHKKGSEDYPLAFPGSSSLLDAHRTVFEVGLCKSCTWKCPRNLMLQQHTNLPTNTSSAAKMGDYCSSKERLCKLIQVPFVKLCCVGLLQHLQP